MVARRRLRSQSGRWVGAGSFAATTSNREARRCRAWRPEVDVPDDPAEDPGASLVYVPRWDGLAG